MAAHTPTDAVFATSVQPDQPQAAWAPWLREIAGAVNQIGAKTTELASIPPGTGPPGPTGPAGPAGATGPAGPTGAAGPAGSANMSGMVAGQLPIAATATSVTSSTASLAASFMPAYTGDVTSPAGSAVNTLVTVPVAKGGTNKTSWTAGSVAFAASATALGENNANFFWDDINNRLSIGGGTATTRLRVTTPTQFDGIAVANATNFIATIIGASATNDNGALTLLSAGTAMTQFNTGGAASFINAGNFGIGTTGPAGKLAVAGNISIQAGSLVAFAGVAATPTGANYALYGDTTQTQVNAPTGPIIFNIGGVEKARLYADGGLTLAAPTGASKGIGTLNAQIGVYTNNVLLTSDADLKTDIAPLPAALPMVQQIEPKSFRWRPLPEPEPVEGPGGEMRLPPPMPPDFTEKANRGFLAQDVVPLLGGAVENGVDLGGLVATLWQAVRELTAKVERLEKL